MMDNRVVRNISLPLLVLTAVCLAAAPVSAEDNPVVARVNSVAIKQSDLDFAALELGSRLSGQSQKDRKKLLLGYVIENQLMASEAIKETLDKTEEFADRRRYNKRRALADTYFTERIKNVVPESAVKKFYDETYTYQDQVHARHILLESEAEAKAVAERLEEGGDFVALRSVKSQNR